MTDSIQELFFFFFSFFLFFCFLCFFLLPFYFSAWSAERIQVSRGTLHCTLCFAREKHLIGCLTSSAGEQRHSGGSLRLFPASTDMGPTPDALSNVPACRQQLGRSVYIQGRRCRHRQRADWTACGWQMQIAARERRIEERSGKRREQRGEREGEKQQYIYNGRAVCLCLL